ncbi:MAG TPA: hypothetical protein VII95_16520 [Terriglobales bacterium]|jgi:hypothetical protein
MISGNLRKAFNRFFLVIAVLWAVYCTVVYPLQQRTEAFHHYEEDQRGCYEGELGQPQSELDECLKLAEEGRQTRVDQWSVKNFYIGAWPLILAAIVGLPLVVYGLVRGLAAVGLWIWRGYKTPSP